jgi:hypothetical protein
VCSRAYSAYNTAYCKIKEGASCKGHLNEFVCDKSAKDVQCTDHIGNVGYDEFCLASDGSTTGVTPKQGQPPTPPKSACEFTARGACEGTCGVNNCEYKNNCYQCKADPTATTVPQGGTAKVSGKVINVGSQSISENSCPNTGPGYTSQNNPTGIGVDLIPLNGVNGGKTIGTKTNPQDGTFSFTQDIPNGEYQVCLRNLEVYTRNGGYEGLKWYCTAQTDQSRKGAKCNKIKYNGIENKDTVFVLNSVQDINLDNGDYCINYNKGCNPDKDGRYCVPMKNGYYIAEKTSTSPAECHYVSHSGSVRVEYPAFKGTIQYGKFTKGNGGDYACYERNAQTCNEKDDSGNPVCDNLCTLKDTQDIYLTVGEGFMSGLFPHNIRKQDYSELVFYIKLKDQSNRAQLPMLKYDVKYNKVIEQQNIAEISGDAASGWTIHFKAPTSYLRNLLDSQSTSGAFVDYEFIAHKKVQATGQNQDISASRETSYEFNDSTIKIEIR